MLRHALLTGLAPSALPILHHRTPAVTSVGDPEDHLAFIPPHWSADFCIIILHKPDSPSPSPLVGLLLIQCGGSNGVIFIFKHSASWMLPVCQDCG
ncbi:hypothetical protein BJY04DRAFT_184143 [Aspergillus karnatakaensis]|uniref:uncharacterized protein n=1 Tax=Aspergillus karnatakaensis TaxID=1810916 RepID=UPI003CCDDEF7